MRFQDGKTKVSVVPNYDVTDHSDIDINIENIIDKDNSDYAYVSLKSTRPSIWLTRFCGWWS